MVCAPRNPKNLRSLNIGLEVTNFVAAGLVSFGFPVNCDCILHRATVTYAIYSAAAATEAQVLFGGNISRGGALPNVGGFNSVQNVFAAPTTLLNLGGSTGINSASPSGDNVFQANLKVQSPGGYNLAQEYNHYMELFSGDSLVVFFNNGGAVTDSELQVNLLMEIVSTIPQGSS